MKWGFSLMEFAWIWKSVLIVLGGTFLLRLAGRKSISQMTLTQTVIMIGIGSLLIQPLAGENIWVTLGVGLMLILTLIAMEYVQIKFNFFEKLLTGSAKVVIENGVLNEKNLKKMRLTVDQLETNLRQQNVTKISDVQWCTLEPNGQIGFTLKPEAQTVTKKDFYEFTKEINQRLDQISAPLRSANLPQPNNQDDIFTEVEQSKHTTPPPEHLQ
jgi:uncharacterized membrane protein YcaP (DUF421 family)